MTTEVLVAVIAVTGVLGAALGGACGSYITARYTSSIKVAILEHQNSCKNIPPMMEMIKLQSQKIDALSERINTLLLILPKRKTDTES